MKRDVEIQRQVQQQLQRDPRVAATHIGVEVSDGVVTLTGVAQSYAEKMAAQEAAHRVQGVLDVANDIRVSIPGGPLRTDTDIAKLVREVLAANIYVPDGNIHTSVSHGWVTLAGTVESERQRDDAEATVRHLPGVNGVVDELSVVPPELEERLVRLIIEEALERRADREAARINVRVEDGTLYLTGHVHSWAERRAILGAAGHVPGVHQVSDQLEVVAGD